MQVLITYHYKVEFISRMQGWFKIYYHSPDYQNEGKKPHTIISIDAEKHLINTIILTRTSDKYYLLTRTYEPYLRYVLL